MLLPSGWAALPGVYDFSWGHWDAPAELAHNLFEGLRTLDERKVDVIVCPIPEGPGLPEAIRDRLHKAAK